jgi:hypothetical protein
MSSVYAALDAVRRDGGYVPWTLISRSTCGKRMSHLPWHSVFTHARAGITGSMPFDKGRRYRLPLPLTHTVIVSVRRRHVPY